MRAYLNRSTLHLRGVQLFRDALIGAAIVVFAIQSCLDPSYQNLVANMLCLGAFLPACLVCFHQRNSSEGASLTAAVVFVAILANSFLPMFGTLLDGHSTIYTLSVPIESFLHRWIWAMILLATHLCAASRGFRGVRAGLGRLVDRIHVREFLPPRALWILGGIGLVTVLARYFFVPRGSVLQKTLEGFDFIRQAPFLILVPPYHRGLQRRPLEVAGLVTLFLFNGYLGITSRMSWVLPLATVATAWLVSFLSGGVVLDQRVFGRAAIVGVFGLLMAAQIKDVSTAILMERGSRNDRAFSEQAAATLRRFLDKEALAAFERERSVESEAGDPDEWRENYVRNPFLGRFILVKFDDNLLSCVGRYSARDVAELKSVTIDKVLALLPGPVVSAMGLSIDKHYVSSFSTGDIMARMGGQSTSLGSLKTGSVLAHAYALFGAGYVVPLFALMLVLLCCLQTLGSRSAFGPPGVAVSSFALLFAFPSFLGFSLDGLSQLVGFMLRGLWQAVLLYGIAVMVVARGLPQGPAARVGLRRGRPTRARTEWRLATIPPMARDRGDLRDDSGIAR